ncbi:MAG: hypothetical protein K2X91_17735 [Thermoleophilia bacterium]|nr:hypothetical protein [Thermoleophilia bacterium]
MPFVIAGLLYALLAVATLAVVGAWSAARGRGLGAGRGVVAGGLGSLVGFLVGGVAAVLIGIGAPGIGTRVGATTIVVPICLATAVAGLAAGLSASATPAKGD